MIGDDAKSAMRKEVRQRRVALTDRAERSERIARRLFQSDWYRDARAVLIYVATGSEASTCEIFGQLIADGRRVAVPYCDGPTLRFCWCENLKELRPGTHDILEPTLQMREQEDRHATANDFDLIITPGVAFDRSGGRLGQGGGYYDRFLAELREFNPQAVVVALAFDCQLVNHVPTDPDDMRVDAIVTETATYDFFGQRPNSS